MGILYIIGGVFGFIILMAAVRLIVYTDRKEREQVEALESENRVEYLYDAKGSGYYYSILNDIAVAIINYRVRNNLTTQKLADRLDVSPEYIGLIEREEANLTLKELVDLVNKLKGKIKVSVSI